MENVYLTGPQGTQWNIGSWIDKTAGLDYGAGGIPRTQIAQGNPFSFGARTAYESINGARVMAFPLRVPSGGVSGLSLDLIESSLRQMVRPGGFVEIQPDGVPTGEIVRFDVLGGDVAHDRYSVDLQRIDRREMRMTLQTQPWGYWPTYITLASCASWGLLPLPIGEVVNEVVNVKGGNRPGQSITPVLAGLWAASVGGGPVASIVPTNNIDETSAFLPWFGFTASNAGAVNTAGYAINLATMSGPVASGDVYYFRTHIWSGSAAASGVAFAAIDPGLPGALTPFSNPSLFRGSVVLNGTIIASMATLEGLFVVPGLASSNFQFGLSFPITASVTNKPGNASWYFARPMLRRLGNAPIDNYPITASYLDGYVAGYQFQLPGPTQPPNDQGGFSKTLGPVRGDLPGPAFLSIQATSVVGGSAGATTIPDMTAWGFGYLPSSIGFLRAASFASAGDNTINVAGPTLINTGSWHPFFEFQRWPLRTGGASAFGLIAQYILPQDALRVMQGRYRAFVLGSIDSGNGFVAADVQPDILQPMASAGVQASFNTGYEGAVGTAISGAIYDAGEISIAYPGGSGLPSINASAAMYLRLWVYAPSYGAIPSPYINISGVFLTPLNGGVLARGMWNTSPFLNSSYNRLQLDGAQGGIYGVEPVADLSSMTVKRDLRPQYYGARPAVGPSTANIVTLVGARIASFNIVGSSVAPAAMSQQKAISVRYQPRFTFLKGI